MLKCKPPWRAQVRSPQLGGPPGNWPIGRRRLKSYPEVKPASAVCSEFPGYFKLDRTNGKTLLLTGKLSLADENILADENFLAI